MASERDELIGLLTQLVGLAPDQIIRDGLRWVGRALIWIDPPAPDLLPPSDDTADGTSQSDWLDDQLARLLPWNAWLANIEDARFAALQEAWQDGFDDVVFGPNSHDQQYAEQLYQSWLVWMDHLSMAVVLDGSEDAIDKPLICGEFVRLIRDWRQSVLEFLLRNSSQRTRLASTDLATKIEKDKESQ